MRYLHLAITVFCAFVISYAQNVKPSSLVNESVESEMRRCRELLFEALRNGDKATANELVDYSVNNYEQGERFCFYLDEYRLIYLILGRDADFLATFSPDHVLSRPIPESHSSFVSETVFLRQLLARRDALYADYNTYLKLSPEDIDFLTIYRQRITSHGFGDLNAACNEYLRQYPSGKYSNFVRESIFFDVNPYDKFGLWLGMSMGARQNTGSMRHLTNGSFELSFDAGATYRRFVFGVHGDISFFGLKNGISKHKIYVPDGEHMSLTSIDIFLGHKFFIPSASYTIGRLYLQPSAGISVSELSCISTDSEKIDFYKDFAFSTKLKPLGVFEVGFENGEISKSYLHGKENYYYLDYGFRYTIRPVEASFDKDTPISKAIGLSNSMSLFIKLGFSRIGHNVKTKY